MTAAELYEIVKDVPKEAWPEIWWSYKNQAWCECDPEKCDVIWFYTNENAELLFTGSMVRWLVTKRSIEIDGPFWFGSQSIHRVETRTGGPHDISSEHEHTTLLAALASSCKAVGGEQ